MRNSSANVLVSTRRGKPTVPAGLRLAAAAIYCCRCAREFASAKMAAAAPHAASQGSGARGEGKDAADASGKGASEAPQRTVELLDHGVLVVRGFLTPEQQLAVVRCCFRLADPARVHENRNMYTPLFAWNWPGNKMGDYVDRAREEREPGLMDEVRASKPLFGGRAPHSLARRC
jgi:hypothetical protein